MEWVRAAAAGIAAAHHRLEDIGDHGHFAVEAFVKHAAKQSQGSESTETHIAQWCDECSHAQPR